MGLAGYHFYGPHLRHPASPCVGRTLVLRTTPWSVGGRARTTAVSPRGAPVSDGKESNMALNPCTIIVGSGPTGMSAAYHLDEDYLMLERDASVGGLNKSVYLNGFTF